MKTSTKIFAAGVITSILGTGCAGSNIVEQNPQNEQTPEADFLQRFLTSPESGVTPAEIQELEGYLDGTQQDVYNMQLVPEDNYVVATDLSEIQRKLVADLVARKIDYDDFVNQMGFEDKDKANRFNTNNFKIRFSEKVYGPNDEPQLKVTEWTYVNGIMTRNDFYEQYYPELETPSVEVLCFKEKPTNNPKRTRQSEADKRASKTAAVLNRFYVDKSEESFRESYLWLITILGEGSLTKDFLVNQMLDRANLHPMLVSVIHAELENAVYARRLSRYPHIVGKKSASPEELRGAAKKLIGFRS